MGAPTNFSVQVKVNNAEALTGYQERLKDLSPAFEEIVTEWAAGNNAKFLASMGMEEAGATIDSLIFWGPVTEKYYQQKHGPVERGHRQIYPDWLLVRSGRLMAAMVEREGFKTDIEPSFAAFGQPQDDDVTNVAKWLLSQEKKRLAIFLGEQDQRMVLSNLYAYVEGQGKYEGRIMPDAGVITAATDLDFGGEGLS